MFLFRFLSCELAWQVHLQDVVKVSAGFRVCVSLQSKLDASLEHCIYTTATLQAPLQVLHMQGDKDAHRCSRGAW